MRSRCQIAYAIRIAGSLFAAISTGWAQGVSPCADSSASVERIALADGALSGRMAVPWMKNSMCITADSLYLKGDFVLLTRGRELEIQVKRGLVVESGALIQAYDYEQEFQRALWRPIAVVDGPINPKKPASYATGPLTNGNPNGGAGRPGGDAWNAHPTGNGAPGFQGGSPEPIRIQTGLAAQGSLRILAAGTNGSRGQMGAAAVAPGNGEQGARGEKDAIGLCGSGPGAGGNGGNGGRGGTPGNGGDGGNGGQVVINVPVTSAFTVEVDVSAGEGGIAGLPGVSSAGGKPGCGGEKGPGLCTPVVWSSQGFYGRSASRHPPAYAGTPGTLGRVDANNAMVVRLDQPHAQCKPFSPPAEEDRIPLDALQQVALLGALAERSFGSPPRQPNPALAMNIIDVASRGNWLSAVDLQLVRNYTSSPAPNPQAFPTGCTNGDCCVPSPSLNCLVNAPWEFNAPSPNTRYVKARQRWLEEFKKVLSIEVARNSRFGADDEIVAASSDGQTWLKWTPNSERSLYTLIDDNLLARIVWIISSVQERLREVLYLPNAPSDEVLTCSNNAVHALKSPVSLASIGYNELRTGPLRPIQIHGQQEPLYFSLPAYYHGDETMFGRPLLSHEKLPTAGYENTQYCELTSRMKANAFHRPFSCSTTDAKLNDLVMLVDRDIDFPGPLSILFSLRFIEAAFLELPADIPSYIERKLFCPPSIGDNY